MAISSPALARLIVARMIVARMIVTRVIVGFDHGPGDRVGVVVMMGIDAQRRDLGLREQR